jgi:hypothetical protein
MEMKLERKKEGERRETEEKNKLNLTTANKQF